jgi:exodeoxyribonuclease V alpha subunit
MTETVLKNVASIEKLADADTTLLDLRGGTLHKILGYQYRSNDFHFRKTNLLPASTVVIDEGSMIDVVLLDKFLQAIDPARTKLILLGDKHQLPSVAAGAVFAEMIPDGNRAAAFATRFVVLTKVFRAGTCLIRLAEQVNQGAFPPVTPCSFTKALAQDVDHWAFVNAQNPDRWRIHLYQWADHHYLTPTLAETDSYAVLINRAGELSGAELMSSSKGQALLNRIFAAVQRVRILSFVRNGVYGCAFINTMVARHLSPHTDPLAGRHQDGFSGALVIITRNDYAKELFNGDVGVIIKDSHNAYSAFFTARATISACRSIFCRPGNWLLP